jgi:hypothetical protein
MLPSEEVSSTRRRLPSPIAEALRPNCKRTETPQAQRRDVLYAAKCFWPGVTLAELDEASARAREVTAARRARGGNAVYLGSVLFPDDELVLCLFDASSRTAVQRASDRAGLPCERVMETAWLPNPDQEGGLIG